MLVLTRKETQAILIGDDIVIRIVHAGKSTVRIGIEAPQAVRVVRGELLTETQPRVARTVELTGERIVECAEAA